MQTPLGLILHSHNEQNCTLQPILVQRWWFSFVAFSMLIISCYRMYSQICVKKVWFSNGAYYQYSEEFWRVLGVCSCYFQSYT
ncbi:hypothetical protein P8452_62674 [Trifolium repens]|nr:hypothetical protein P8452_62674 [Trifolium repens]